MDPKKLYHELKDYQKMKHRDVEISMKIEQNENKYRNKEREIRKNRVNYRKYSNSRQKDFYGNQSVEVFFLEYFLI